MTKEERKEAERLAKKEFLYDRPNEYGVYPERRAYVRGYAAACEAKRAEIDEHKNNYLSACQTVAAMHEAATGVNGEGPKRGVVEDVADVRTALEAERARSAKLIETMLWYADGFNYQNSSHDPTYEPSAMRDRGEIARIAIAKYNQD